jgi:anti-anti-sigma regulatory factor
MNKSEKIIPGHSAPESTVVLTGALGVEDAAALREALLAALAASARVAIDAAGVSGIDLTCLQVLCAAHRTAMEGGKDIRIEGCCAPEFAESVRAAGFPMHAGCRHNTTGSCLWQGGESYETEGQARG